MAVLVVRSQLLKKKTLLKKTHLPLPTRPAKHDPPPLITGTAPHTSRSPLSVYRCVRLPTREEGRRERRRWGRGLGGGKGGTTTETTESSTSPSTSPSPPPPPPPPPPPSPPPSPRGKQSFTRDAYDVCSEGRNGEGEVLSFDDDDGGVREGEGGKGEGEGEGRTNYTTTKPTG